jgi:hypothetical protein
MTNIARAVPAFLAANPDSLRPADAPIPALETGGNEKRVSWL